MSMSWAGYGLAVAGTPQQLNLSSRSLPPTQPLPRVVPTVSGSPSKPSSPLATLTIVAICVCVYAYDVLSSGTWVHSSSTVGVGPELVTGLGDLTLYRPSLLHEGEWYRVLTTGFVHLGPAHLVMNMLVLWQLGRVVERKLGALLLTTLFVTGVLGGALGATVLEPEAQVGGASGALFALMGALAMMQLLAGKNILRSGILVVLAINVGLSFLPFVSLGAHLGGLAAGLVAGAIVGVSRWFGDRPLALAPIGVAAVGLAALVLTMLEVHGWVSIQSELTQLRSWFAQN